MGDEARREEPAIIGAFSAMNQQAISVHQERCAKVRNRNVECLKCAAACTSGCISLQDGQLVINAAKCVGCGTCATVCPTCALEANNPNDEQLLLTCLKAQRDGSVVIACGLALKAAAGLVDETRVASVICAGRIDESLIVRLVQAGAQDVRVVCGQCDKCAQRLGRQTVDAVMASANDLLETWGNQARASVSSSFPTDALYGGVSEEACRYAQEFFFKQEQCNEPLPWADNADAPADDFVLPHVMRDRTLPHFLPDRRERLLDALCDLGDPVKQRLSSRLWGMIVIDGLKCVSCRMCATFCPTGAIVKFDEEDGTFGVRHFPADCVKCRSCQDICPADAILIMDEVPTSYLTDAQCHRYVMKERPTTLNNAHQILSHMQHQLAGNDIFER